MPFTWKFSGHQPVSPTSHPADWWTIIRGIINTDAAAGDSFWEVASFSDVSPRYLLLRRKNGAPGRIIFFGETGVAPHANATRTAPTSGQVNVGFSADSTQNTPDSLSAGAPLSGSGYMRAIAGSAAHIPTRMAVIQHPDGVIVLHRSTASSSCNLFGAGLLVESPTGVLLPSLWANASNHLVGSWLSLVTTSALISPVPTNDGSFGGGLIVRAMGPGTQLADRTTARIHSMAGIGGNTWWLRDESLLTTYFFPIHLAGPADVPAVPYIGKLRQVAMGPRGLAETTWTKNSAPMAYGHHFSTVTPGEAIWFTNFDI
jgi:hypothetical protein